MRVKRYISLIGLLVAGLISGCATSQTAKAPAEPTVEYFKLDSGKLVPGKEKAKAAWENTGKLGGKPVKGFGYGPNGETVMFESELAQKEYDKRHEGSGQ